MITLKKLITDVIKEIEELKYDDISWDNKDFTIDDYIEEEHSPVFQILYGEPIINPDTFDIRHPNKEIKIKDLKNYIIILLDATDDLNVINITLDGKEIRKDSFYETEDDSLAVALTTCRELASKIEQPIYNLRKE